jgi:hypothetical protein
MHPRQLPLCEEFGNSISQEKDAGVVAQDEHIESL